MTIATMRDLPPYVLELIDQANDLRSQAARLTKAAAVVEREINEALASNDLGQCPEWCEGGMFHAWRFRSHDDTSPASLSREHEGRNDSWRLWTVEFLRSDGTRDIGRPMRRRLASDEARSGRNEALTA